MKLTTNLATRRYVNLRQLDGSIGALFANRAFDRSHAGRLLRGKRRRHADHEGREKSRRPMNRSEHSPSCVATSEVDCNVSRIGSLVGPPCAVDVDARRTSVDAMPNAGCPAATDPTGWLTNRGKPGFDRPSEW